MPCIVACVVLLHAAGGLTAQQDRPPNDLGRLRNVTIRTRDVAAERQDLVPQLTLGEDNGLRGCPAREFSGIRYARLNLENRIDTGLEVLSVRLGAAAFCDVGWMHDPSQGLSMSDPIRAVGVGLRLGSSHLFGSKVLRLDVAWPLDDYGGEDYGVSVSFATGQVFTVFGNASELRRDF
jgi:hypothetical protein